jgi:peroxiredoxin
VPSINTGVDSVNNLLGDLTLLSSNVSTLTVDSYPANSTIVFHVPSINTGVDSVNNLLGDLTLLSSNVSTLTIDSYSANSTIVFNVPSINTGVDSVNNILGDITLLSANVSTLSIDTYPANSTIVLKVPSATILPNDDWANFPAINDVIIPNHDLNMTTTTPGISYNTASFNSNFIIGNPSNLPLRPDMTAYCGTVTFGGLATPLTGMTINSLGTVNVNSLAGLSLLGGGGISIAGAGAISAVGSTITLGAGAVSALGGSIDLGGGTINMAGGTINMAGGIINALGTAVNVGGGLITATTGGLLVTAGSVVVGTASIAGAGMVCYGGTIQTFPSITGGGGGLEMNSCPITGVTTINGAAYPPASTTFADSFQIYVAPNGNNTTGTGSQQNPYLTIARAITQRATISNTTEVSIILSSGTYAESFTLTRNTFLVGVQTGEIRQPCNITGTITMSDTLGGSIGLTGLEINGPISMTGVAGLFFTIFGCNISGGASTAVTANSGSFFITESRISSTGGRCISSATAITARDCILTQFGTNPCLETSGGSTTIRQCYISSSSTSTTPSALIRFTNTGAATSEIGLCRIEYTSNTTDTGGNKCCIQYAGSALATTSVYQNLLLCEGAITGGSQIQCIQDTGTAAVNMFYGGLLAGQTAHHISPDVNKTQYNNVP